jgi:hypothetical protein
MRTAELCFLQHKTTKQDIFAVHRTHTQTHTPTQTGTHTFEPTPKCTHTPQTCIHTHVKVNLSILISSIETIYRVCRGFRQMEQDDYFQVYIDDF